MESLFVERPLRIANWVYSTDQSCLTHFEHVDSELLSTAPKLELSSFLEQVVSLLPQAVLPSSSIRIVQALQDERTSFLHIHDVFVVGNEPLVLAGQTSKLQIGAYTSANVRLGRKGWLTTFPMAPDENPVHALKAPVNRILGIASILQKTSSEDPEKRELYAFLEQSSERLKRLVQWLLNEETPAKRNTAHDTTRYIARFLAFAYIESEYTDTSGPYGAALLALLAGAEEMGFEVTLSGGWSIHGHAYLDFIMSADLLDVAIADRIASNGWIFPVEVINYLRTDPNVPLIVIQNGNKTVYRLAYTHPTVQVETQKTSFLVQ